MHSLIVGLAVYLAIAVLMVPCRLLPLLLWPAYKVVADHVPERLPSMNLRRFFQERLDPSMVVPVFFTSPLYFAAGVITAVANVLTGQLTKAWIAWNRSFNFSFRSKAD